MNIAAHIRNLLVMMFLGWSLSSQGQQVIDDFEQANLDDWVTVQGIAQISDVYAYADLLSVQLVGTNMLSVIRHATVREAFGKYRIKCYVVGVNTEARMRFQYISDLNYYEVVSRPIGTNESVLALYKVIDGQPELLGEVPALVKWENWYQITVHRTCSGEILVYTNDVLQIAAVDTDLLEAGSIGLGSQGGSSYFDDVTFENDQGDIFIDIDTSICAGSELVVGSMTYLEQGVYTDTITIGEDCDSIIHVNLALRESIEVYRSDTICDEEIYLFGGDTLNISGTFRQTWLASSGCDSSVNLTLWRLSDDTIRLDSTLCMGESVLFAGEVLSESGVYYDTLSSKEGCFGIVALHLELVALEDFLGPDIKVCIRANDVLRLQHPTFTDISWSDGSAGSTLTITQPGNYWAQVTLGSCTWRDSINVISECDSNANVFIPNAFSPNGDSVNDYFVPEFAVPPHRYSLRLFDRFGQLIYVSTNPSSGWDGRVDGQGLSVGTYVYIIEIDGEQYSGSVTLMR